MYPNLLADADGKIGVDFRVCDLKPRPVTISGTTPMPPETVRTGDMAGWTSGERHLMTCHDVTLLLAVSLVSHGNSECVESFNGISRLLTIPYGFERCFMMSRGVSPAGHGVL